jgi:hypothetical protein
MTERKKLHRANAGVTSVEAAHKVDVKTAEMMVLKAIMRAGKKGMTQDELLQMFPYPIPYSTVTARPAALKRKGEIRESGEFRLGRSGVRQKVLVWAGVK